MNNTNLINPLESMPHLNVLAKTLKRSIIALDQLMQNCDNATTYTEYQGERDILVQTYHCVCNRRKEILEEQSLTYAMLASFLNTNTLGHA